MTNGNYQPPPPPPPPPPPEKPPPPEPELDGEDDTVDAKFDDIDDISEAIESKLKTMGVFPMRRAASFTTKQEVLQTKC